jgi:hypothetical protein
MTTKDGFETVLDDILANWGDTPEWIAESKARLLALHQRAVKAELENIAGLWSQSDALDFKYVELSAIKKRIKELE